LHLHIIILYNLLSV